MLNKSITLVLLAAFAIAVSNLAFFFAFAPPHSIAFWFSLVMIDGVVFIATALGIAAMSQANQADKPSGASYAILFTGLAAFLPVSLVIIGISKGLDLSDSTASAILLILIFFATLAFAAIHLADKGIQKSEAPVIAERVTVRTQLPDLDTLYARIRARHESTDEGFNQQHQCLQLMQQAIQEYKMSARRIHSEVGAEIGSVKLVATTDARLALDSLEALNRSDFSSQSDYTAAIAACQRLIQACRRLSA